MAKSMTKSQIADHLAQKTGLTKKASVQLMDDFAALAYKEAKNVFVIPGSGSLYWRTARLAWDGTRRPARPSRFPPSVWSSSA